MFRSNSNGWQNDTPKKITFSLLFYTTVEHSPEEKVIYVISRRKNYLSTHKITKNRHTNIKILKIKKLEAKKKDQLPRNT